MSKIDLNTLDEILKEETEVIEKVQKIKKKKHFDDGTAAKHKDTKRTKKTVRIQTKELEEIDY